MSPNRNSAPLLQALFVTFLWSTSWVLIKVGLEELPALTFAGLRYVLAVLVLGAWAQWRGRLLPGLAALDGSQLSRLLVLGVVMYTLTQGAQFMALDLLPANTVSLVLSFTPAIVAVAGVAVLGERSSTTQWAGMITMVLGAALFLLPIASATLVGLAVAAGGAVANATGSLGGRAVNRRPGSDPLTVTVVSMGVGSIFLLASGLAIEGMPDMSVRSWGIVAWLAVVNTAFAFTLWNHTLRSLTAVESSVINNTMLIQIAALAWIFLGERLGWREVAGIALVALGALVVQVRRRP